MNLKELKKIVSSETKFKAFITKLLKTTQNDEDFDETSDGIVVLGYDDGYYWEQTKIELLDGGVLKVTFDIGSGSGWIEPSYTEENLTVEQFRQYLLNRKWANDDIDTLRILKSEIDDIPGAKVLSKVDDESGYWEKNLHKEW